MKRMLCLVVAGLACAVSTAWSQEAGQGQRRGRMGMGDVEQAVVLAAEQKEKVQALQEKARTQMQEQMGQRDPAAMTKMRETRQQMLEAAKAGDDKKVESLRKEVNETEFVAKRRKLAADYYDEVEKVLTPEQKKPFQAWRKLIEAEVPASVLGDAEALKTALKKVDLSDVQKKAVDAALVRYEKDAAKDAQAKKTATVDLAAEVVGVLKPSQKVLLSDAAGGMGTGGGRGGRQAPASAPASGG
jgi:Spy/CpxP family protein refolding chaperone